MKITVTHDNGQTVDITEGCRVLYDQMVSSMNWGSGFLDFEEVNAIRSLGYACGFEWIDYELDTCRDCGHGFRDHREGRERRCWKGRQQHDECYVLVAPGTWQQIESDWEGRMKLYSLPPDQRRVETIVDVPGCSCGEYARPLLPEETT